MILLLFKPTISLLEQIFLPHIFTVIRGVHGYLAINILLPHISAVYRGTLTEQCHLYYSMCIGGGVYACACTASAQRYTFYGALPQIEKRSGISVKIISMKMKGM